MSALLDSADELKLEVKVVDEEDWAHGDAKGVCKGRSALSMQPLIEVKARSNDADLATTLVHEYAHAQLHFDVYQSEERAKREVEAEAVAYLVGRNYGHDTSASAIYLAAWRGDDSEVIKQRIKRISTTAEKLIAVIDAGMADSETK